MRTIITHFSCFVHCYFLRTQIESNSTQINTDKTSTIIMAPLLYNNEEVLVPEVNDDDIFYNIIINEEEGGEYDGDDSFTTAVCSHSFTSVVKSSSESKSRTVIRRRSVSFSNKAQVYFGSILHINDYTPTEKFNCWYGMNELRQIRKENTYILSLIVRLVPHCVGSLLSFWFSDAPLWRSPLASVGNQHVSR